MKLLEDLKLTLTTTKPPIHDAFQRLEIKTEFENRCHMFRT